MLLGIRNDRFLTGLAGEKKYYFINTCM